MIQIGLRQFLLGPSMPNGLVRMRIEYIDGKGALAILAFR